MDLSGIDFRETDLGGANLHLADLSDSLLQEASLIETNLSWANLQSASLGFDHHVARPVNLRNANLTKADLTKADLSGAWLISVNLKKAILVQANLSETSLQTADFTEADLTESNLMQANFFNTIMTKANLRKANIRGADFRRGNFCEADLSESDLRLARLVETNLEKANLENCLVYGVSAWNVKLDGANQSNLRVSESGEPPITVDNLEVAQFIYSLLNHKQLRQVLNSVMERWVLILGRFGGGGLEILQYIAKKLREMTYLPFIFDFDRPRNHTYTETVKPLVGLSRFVIVDLSGPSVPQELYATVPHYKIPFVPI